MFRFSSKNIIKLAPYNLAENIVFKYTYFTLDIAMKLMYFRIYILQYHFYIVIYIYIYIHIIVLQSKNISL